MTLMVGAGLAPRGCIHLGYMLSLTSVDNPSFVRRKLIYI